MNDREAKMLEFLRRLANAHEYDSRDSGRVIVASWKDDAQDLVQEMDESISADNSISRATDGRITEEPQ